MESFQNAYVSESNFLRKDNIQRRELFPKKKYSDSPYQEMGIS